MSFKLSPGIGHALNTHMNRSTCPYDGRPSCIASQRGADSKEHYNNIPNTIGIKINTDIFYSHELLLY